MSAAVTFEVLHSLWAAGEDEDACFSGGLHEDVPLTPELAQLLAGAEAAGAVIVLDVSKAGRKQLDDHVQSQADGEAALKRALGTWIEPVFETRPDGSRSIVEHGYWTGAWRHGNLSQFVVSCEDRLAFDDQLAGDDEDKLDAGDRAALEQAAAKAREDLDQIEEPS